jgi:hypothetical protein
MLVVYQHYDTNTGSLSGVAPGRRHTWTTAIAWISRREANAVRPWSSVLCAAHMFAYSGCGSCLFAIYLGNELILIDIRKPFRSSACLVRLAGPCPAERAHLECPPTDFEPMA